MYKYSKLGAVFILIPYIMNVLINIVDFIMGKIDLYVLGRGPINSIKIYNFKIYSIMLVAIGIFLLAFDFIYNYKNIKSNKK